MYEAFPKRCEGLAVHEQRHMIRAGSRSELLARWKRPNIHFRILP